jgi:hypothetical protein
VNIYQSFIGSSCYYQESFSFISTFEWCAADRRHEYRLAIGSMNEVGLLFVCFLFPFIPAISKTNCTT